MTPCATEEIPEEETKNTKASSINWLFKTPVSPTSSQRDQTSSMMNTGIILQLIISLCFAFEEPPLSLSVTQYFSGLSPRTPWITSGQPRPLAIDPAGA